MLTNIKEYTRWLFRIEQHHVNHHAHLGAHSSRVLGLCRSGWEQCDIVPGRRALEGRASCPSMAKLMSMSMCGLPVGEVYIQCVRRCHLASGGEGSRVLCLLMIKLMSMSMCGLLVGRVYIQCVRHCRLASDGKSSRALCPLMAELMSMSMCGLLVGRVYVQCVRCHRLASGGEGIARREVARVAQGERW
jgi:hypothetical protein